jgi:hypothetical protein
MKILEINMYKTNCHLKGLLYRATAEQKQPSIMDVKG